MSVPARRLRQTLFVDGGRRCRSLRQSQPVKSKASPTTSAVEQTIFLPSQFSFWTSRYLSPKHLSLGVAAMWLLIIISSLASEVRRRRLPDPSETTWGAEVICHSHEPPLLAVRELE